MIKQFTGDYAWLSNFWYFDKPLVLDGISYPTNEHYYQAMKSLDDRVRKQIAVHPSKGLKGFAKNIKLRSDWEEVKDLYMKCGLEYKFSEHNLRLRTKLLDTEDEVLEEGNWWGDIYWGIDLRTNDGLNKLGKLIMQIREDIRD